MNKQILEVLQNKYQDLYKNILLPPPVFVEMGGEILEYDENSMIIKIMYPLKAIYANPFGKMQGGIVAAAIDNTFGPLSMLSAKLNYTRSLEVKYKKQIDIKSQFIIVEAEVNEQTAKRICMKAKVYDYNGCVMATAEAVNWVVQN